MQQGRGVVGIYRKPLLRRILAAIILPAIILLLVATIGLMLLNNIGPLPASKIAGFIALGGLALVLLWLLANELTYEITLTDGAIAVSRWGWARILAYSEIAGRREFRSRGRRWLTIVPADPQAKPLRLASGLATDAYFETWIAGLRDLNAEDLRASEAEIAGDPSYGATPQERLARLTRARTIMKWVNMAAVFVAVWCIIAPWPYLAAIGAAAILPALASIVVAASGGLVRFARSRTEAYAGAGAIPLFCAVALALRAHWDVYLVDWGLALKTGGVAGLLLLAIAALVDRSLARRTPVLGIAAVVALTYGVAVLILADVHFDHSTGQDFQSRILGSRISRGKATSYFVKLAPWGPSQSADEILVSQTMFNQLMPGASACIRMFEGAFSIRWFAVSVCPPGASNASGPFNKFDQVAPGTDAFGPPRFPCPPGQEPVTTGSPPLLVCRAR